MSFASPSAAKGKRKVLLARSPLPPRKKRVQNPGAPNMPRAKRSSDEVEAELAEVQALKAQVAELHQKRVDAFAQLEITEQLAAKVQADSTIKFKAVAPLVGAKFGRSEQAAELDGMDSDTPLLAFDDADFDAVEEANERIRYALKKDKAERKREQNRYNLSKLPPLPVPAKVPKADKKGDARAAVDKAKAKMVSGILSGNDSDTAPSKPKLKPAFPVGVHNNWRERVTVPGTASSSKTKSTPLGGLADLDTEGLRPPNTKKKCLPANDTIELITDSDNDSDDTPVRRKPIPKYTGKNIDFVKQEPKPRQKVRVKAEVSVDATVAEVIGLPEFTRSGWVTVFIPTWYHFIGTGPGWEFCALGDEVQTIQKIVDVVFPGTTWKVKKHDPIYTSAMSRLGDKRHQIGSATMKIPKKIARYAKYAIDEHGPGWYEIPAPRNQEYLPGVPGWIPPSGLFRREFGTHYIGAAAMIGAGLERAFNQYTTGVKVPNGSFSYEHVGDYVEGFAKSARGHEAFRWKKIMAACSSRIRAQAGPLISASSSMNLNRGALYPGSSPVKGSDDDDDY
ncbi:hypothetical protein B0H17DRAFT_1218013 [Mycena rosella]|uniref:Uncharacterized protein n=1 Tax=Mycena rosella TaxID=1033263 RepID=A0AAD7BTW3_MYCRO|nr:hypothetical protein B0H17DRAFT_1218013 [Mycena rosella]